jgi:hypothetical protein
MVFLPGYTPDKFYEKTTVAQVFLSVLLLTGAMTEIPVRYKICRPRNKERELKAE